MQAFQQSKSIPLSTSSYQQYNRYLTRHSTSDLAHCQRSKSKRRSCQALSKPLKKLLRRKPSKSLSERRSGMRRLASSTRGGLYDRQMQRALWRRRAPPAAATLSRQAHSLQFEVRRPSKPLERPLAAVEMIRYGIRSFERVNSSI